MNCFSHLSFGCKKSNCETSMERISDLRIIDLSIHFYQSKKVNLKDFGKEITMLPCVFEEA